MNAPDAAGRQPRSIGQDALRPESPVAVTSRTRGQGEAGPYQVHAHCEMGVVLAGAYRMQAGEVCLTLGRGGVWWLGPWEPHQYTVLAGQTEYIVVEMLPSVVFSHLHAGADVPPLYLPFLRHDIRGALQPRTADAVRRVTAIAGAIQQESGAQRPGRAGALEALLHVLLVELLRGHTFGMQGQRTAEVGRVLSVIEHINGNLARPLRLRDLAALAGFGRTRFVRLFKQVTGSTCADYIVRRRLECARMEIREDRLKLDAIARHWGFYDASHLQRLYRKHYGMSPARERSAARGF